MIKRRNTAAAALIFAVCIVLNVRCNLLVSFAPMLLQGAVAMARTGEATIVTRSGTRIRLTKNMKLTAEGIVLPGSRLITGSNASADLVFTDSIRMRLGPNSSITLDSARILEDKNFTQIKMKLTQGRIFADAGKLTKNSSLAVSTLRSIVNVRGTEFLVEETGSSNSVIVADGAVAVSDEQGKDPVYIEEGKSAAVSSSGRVSVQEMNAEQKSLVKTMSEDIASLKAADKQRIREIIETNEENKRLIKEAYEAQKEAISAAVIIQKETNAANLSAQKETDAAAAGKIKSSAADEIKRIKDAAKKNQ